MREEGLAPDFLRRLRVVCVCVRERNSRENERRETCFRFSTHVSEVCVCERERETREKMRDETRARFSTPFQGVCVCERERLEGE